MPKWVCQSSSTIAIKLVLDWYTSIELSDRLEMTDSAQQTLRERLEQLEYAIRLSRRAGKIVKQNIAFALRGCLKSFICDNRKL